VVKVIRHKAALPVLDRHLFALKIALSHVSIWTPSDTWFLGSNRVHFPNGVSLCPAIFAGLTIMSARPTDHATPGVTIGWILLVLQCGLIILSVFVERKIKSIQIQFFQAEK